MTRHPLPAVHTAYRPVSSTAVKVQALRATNHRFGCLSEIYVSLIPQRRLTAQGYFVLYERELSIDTHFDVAHVSPSGGICHITGVGQLLETVDAARAADSALPRRTRGRCRSLVLSTEIRYTVRAPCPTPFLLDTGVSIQNHTPGRSPRFKRCTTNCSPLIQVRVFNVFSSSTSVNNQVV